MRERGNAAGSSIARYLELTGTCEDLFRTNYIHKGIAENKQKYTDALIYLFISQKYVTIQDQNDVDQAFPVMRGVKDATKGENTEENTGFYCHDNEDMGRARNSNVYE